MHVDQSIVGKDVVPIQTVCLMILITVQQHTMIDQEEILYYRKSIYITLILM